MGGCESKKDKHDGKFGATYELDEAAAYDHGEQLYSDIPPPDASLDGFHVCLVARFAIGLNPQTGPAALRFSFLNNDEELTTEFIPPDANGTVTWHSTHHKHLRKRPGKLVVQLVNAHGAQVVATGEIADMSKSGDTGSQLHQLEWSDLGVALELTSSMKHEVATRVLEHRWISTLGMVTIELLAGEGLRTDEPPVAGTASLNGNVKSGRVVRMWLADDDLEGIITISAQDRSGTHLGTASARLGPLLGSEGPVRLPCDHEDQGCLIVKLDWTSKQDVMEQVVLGLAWAFASGDPSAILDDAQIVGALNAAGRGLRAPTGQQHYSIESLHAELMKDRNYVSRLLRKLRLFATYSFYESVADTFLDLLPLVSAADRSWLTGANRQYEVSRMGCAMDCDTTQVYDPHHGTVLREPVPHCIQVAIQIASTRGKSHRSVFRQMSEWMQQRICSPESHKMINSFREAYAVSSLDFSEALPTKAYSSFAEFMARDPAPGSRPLFMESDPCEAVIPADGCCLAFTSVEQAVQTLCSPTSSRPLEQVSRQFMHELLSPLPSAVADRFRSSSMVLCRKDTKDCQWWMLPVEATVLSVHSAGSEFFPLHPQLFGSSSRSLNHFGKEHEASMPFEGDFALLNLITSNCRSIHRLLSPWFGNVLVVTVGSVFVDGRGIRDKHVKVGASGSKGAEAGYFEFPGAFTIVLFEERAINLHEELVSRSTRLVETRVRAGESLGSAADTENKTHKQVEDLRLEQQQAATPKSPRSQERDHRVQQRETHMQTKEVQTRHAKAELKAEQERMAHERLEHREELLERREEQEYQARQQQREEQKQQAQQERREEKKQQQQAQQQRREEQQQQAQHRREEQQQQAHQQYTKATTQSSTHAGETMPGCGDEVALWLGQACLNPQYAQGLAASGNCVARLICHRLISRLVAGIKSVVDLKSIKQDKVGTLLCSIGMSPNEVKLFRLSL